MAKAVMKYSNGAPQTVTMQATVPSKILTAQICPNMKITKNLPKHLKGVI